MYASTKLHRIFIEDESTYSSHYYRWTSFLNEVGRVATNSNKNGVVNSTWYHYAENCIDTKIYTNKESFQIVLKYFY